MPRSSESVAALAGALAKAQSELVNPEKLLTATVRNDRLGQSERSFRYASLSSGLDIVRKTLGQHEIAIMQTTAIDTAVGMVNLTTTLAHASGEWIASDWPVCPTAETGNPRRMGAALTYARRYALFTLVGIAGEDDLDAPDLATGTPSPADPPLAAPVQPARAYSPRPTLKKPANGGFQYPGAKPEALLDPGASATLRDSLIAEVDALLATDLASVWAQTGLARKNRLMATDATVVEQAFESKLAQLMAAEPAEASVGQPLTPKNVPPATSAAMVASNADDRMRCPGIDKSVLKIAEPRRYRSKEHLRFVAKQACLVCARKPSDPHHLRFMQPRAMGRKVSDEFTVPLCRIHHRELHLTGDEKSWWTMVGINPTKTAQELWQLTRGSSETADVSANE